MNIRIRIYYGGTREGFQPAEPFPELQNRFILVLIHGEYSQNKEFTVVHEQSNVKQAPPPLGVCAKKARRSLQAHGEELIPLLQRGPGHDAGTKAPTPSCLSEYSRRDDRPLYF